MRYLFVLITIAFVNLCVSYVKADTWDGISSDTSWYNEEQSEFHINSAAQLKGLADLVNNDKISFDASTIYLDSDINLNNFQWVPIGIGKSNWNGAEFSGNFNGNGYAIDGLYIDCSNLPNYHMPAVGLFGYSYGEIRNLEVNGFIIINNEYYFQTMMECCFGGIVGNGNIISDCKSDLNVFYNINTQWLTYIGYAAGKAKSISRVKTTGTFSQEVIYPGNFGCVVAFCDEVSECESSGVAEIRLTESSNNSFQGGIAGSSSVVNNCIFTGVFRMFADISNYKDGCIGGIVGNCSDVQNVIFAAKDYSNNMNTYNKGIICAPYDIPNVFNAYYLDSYDSGNGYGIPMSEDLLKSGNIIEGFSPDIWIFKTGHLPSLRSLRSKHRITFPINDGMVGVEVEENDDITLNIEPNIGWQISYVYVNGEDVTNKLCGSKLILYNVMSDYDVTIVFKNDDSKVKELNSNFKDISLKLENDSVVLSGLSANSLINVYKVDGQFIAKYVSDDSLKINLGKGAYIIQVEDFSYKIII